MKMADFKEKEQEIRDTFLREKEELKKTYNEIVEKLKKEGDKLQGDIQKEYDNARKYVKEHPETGLGIALAGGLLIGFAIAKILNR
jgi:ElaB/YqjD/DUF883 family membrane-anchored ribosome-binding protein